jgi:hypothetical protein
MCSFWLLNCIYIVCCSKTYLYSVEEFSLVCTIIIIYNTVVSCTVTLGFLLQCVILNASHFHASLICLDSECCACGGDVIIFTILKLIKSSMDDIDGFCFEAKIPVSFVSRGGDGCEVVHGGEDSYSRHAANQTILAYYQPVSSKTFLPITTNKANAY